MPKYLVPHPLDGPGIGKHLKDKELDCRLAELANTANQHHVAAKGVWREWLNHARAAGDALIEANHRCGKRSRWTKWRRKYFKGSKETANVYTRVARYWCDETIAKAIESGKIDSIASFLRAVRELQRDKADEERSRRDQRTTEARKQVAAEIRKRLDELSLSHVQALSDDDTMAEVWRQLIAELDRRLLLENADFAFSR